MYLKKGEMIKAIREATRIVKPGGSMVFTHFIEPGGKRVGSIITKVKKSFWKEKLEGMGLEDIRVYNMAYQGDRYQLTCRKKIN